MPNRALGGAALAAAIGFMTSACSASPTGGWTAHRDARFSLETPRTWKVSPDASSGRVRVEGPRQERLIIWPVFLSRAVDARSAAGVLRRLAASAGVTAEWGPPRPAGTSALRMAGRGAGRASLAAFAWVSSPKGSAGTFYAAGAPEAVYSEALPTFAKVLASFRPAGAPAREPAKPAVTYAAWADPRENAFSFEAPTGWKVNGGMFRMAPVDTRGAFEVLSPDGAIRIIGGDAELPTFTEPNQMLAMTGFHEGSWYSPGYGVRMMVRRYTPPLYFLKEYVPARMAQGCAALAFAEERERPEAAAGLNAMYAPLGASGAALRLEAAETAFSCRDNGRDMAGYAFAGILHTRVAGMPGGLWHVDYLTGYRAPREQAPLAQEVLRHMLATFRINPQWAAMQSRVSANTSRIVSEAHNEISNIISSTYWNRQGVMDEISRRRSNATLGVVDVIDAATGEQFQVESSSNYYWIDHRGTIVGTETHTVPSIDFREMLQLP